MHPTKNKLFDQSSGTNDQILRPGRNVSSKARWIILTFGVFVGNNKYLNDHVFKKNDDE